MKQDPPVARQGVPRLQPWGVVNSYPLKAVLKGPQATREEGDGRTIVVPVARIIDMRTVPDGYEPRHRD
jgi:hypothetical protein